jgi:Flp pilus assembly protein TadG
MTRNERGYVLIYMTVVLAALLVFSGLAVDTGRAYVVKAQLTKAVDGAALAAARSLNSGSPQAEAQRVFTANFPPGYLGTTGPDPTTAPNFFASAVDATTGVNTVTINASQVLPTTFMALANFNNMTIASTGQATRRMVDLSLVLDVSSSIGSQWSTVRDAVRTFINGFDAAHDRMALLTFSNGAQVIDAMPSTRGFDKPKLVSDVPNTLPGGSTNMVEGLYRGWDELRSVPSGTQSGLRVIVLFTDGASNSVPGNYDVAPGVGLALRTWDFPKTLPDPDSQTWDAPHIDGLYDTSTGVANPSVSLVPSNWNNKCSVPNSCVPSVPLLPLTSWHAHHRSSGIPTQFPLQTASLMVDGMPQSSARGLRDKDPSSGRYPAEVFNINNAARNLVEIISDAARSDNGDYPIRIYTIGMGYLVRLKLGTRPELPEDILKRMANDPSSADCNGAQLAGKYYYAQTAAEVGPAFQALQNEIIRLSK